MSLIFEISFVKIEYIIKEDIDENLKIKSTLPECGNKNVENEAKYILQNVPVIF